MKKTLLFAILAFSINAFAQHQPSDPLLSYLSANSKHNSGHQQSNLQHPSVIYSPSNPNQGMNHSSRDLFGLEQRFDSIYMWQWDSLSLAWQVQSKFIDILYDANNYPTSFTGQLWNVSSWDNYLQLYFTYDANGNQTLAGFRQWTGTSWQDFFQTVYTYDTHNDVLIELDQVWTGFSWMNTDQYLYTYDGNHNDLTETEQNWDGTTWVNIGRYVYTYSANQDELTDVYQTWDDIDQVWINSDRDVNTYDANHNKLTDTFQTWNGISWDDTFLSTYTYDGNNNMITQLSQNWDNTSWENSDKTNYTYSGHTLLTGLRQHWNFGSWVNASRVTYTHDVNNLTPSVLNEDWDGSTWLKSDQSFFSYDENEFVLGQGNRTFDDAGELIIEGDSTHYYFRTVTGTKDLVTDDSSLSIYPNPSTGKFTLTSLGSINEIDVFNFIGERVYSAKYTNGLSSSEVNMSGYPIGVYMIVVKDGTNLSSKKIMIQ